jgi:hypothetical protein
VKHLFKVGAKHEVRDGTRTSFWLDWWLGNAPLKDSFLDLFAICESHDIYVACACHDFDLAVPFCHSLNQEGLRQWRELVQRVQDVELVPGRDKVSWHLEQSGKFSVKSMYASLSLGATVAHFKDMWETNLPLKIKIFSWQLALDKFRPDNRLLFDMARQMDAALFVEP